MEELEPPESSCAILAQTLTENFSCAICEGYLIRPVAITECLHYFCRSCIVDHLENKGGNRCPSCDTVMHETDPWSMLREDKTLELLILKLIPGLANNEKQRRNDFYEGLGTTDPELFDGDSNLSMCVELEPPPLASPSAPSSQHTTGTDSQDSVASSNAADETKTAVASADPPKPTSPKSLGPAQIGFQLRRLEPAAPIDTEATPTDEAAVVAALAELEFPFVRTSSHATISTLKKFVRERLGVTEECDVDILCNGELMGRHHTLEFIYMTRWRYKEDAVLMLDYRPKMQLRSCR